MKQLKFDDNDEDLNVSKWMRGKSGNKNRKKCMPKSNSKGFDMSKYKCFICHKTGHF